MDEATRIINTATNEELVKMHFEELTKIRKLRLVIKELKQIDCSKLMLPDKKQVEKSIALIKIGEYFFLNGKKDHVLDLCEMSSITLNYTERKALLNLLKNNLLKELQIVSSFNLKLRTELPEVFSENNELQNQILSLEEQRRVNLEKLIQLRNRKCNFLKVVAELKMGPYLECELEVMYAKARQNQTKVNLLRGYFTNELLTRTDHNLKAIREVESYINGEVETAPDIRT